jgi:hypothetical protein
MEFWPLLLMVEKMRSPEPAVYEPLKLVPICAKLG